MRHASGDPALPEILALIRSSFAYMDGRVDPPSSVHVLDIDALAAQAQTSEIWTIGPPPVACMILTPKQEALYIGKLCVATQCRGQGLARRLISLAEERRAELGLPCLELQTRVELTENHAAFAALGFREVARTAHPGFDRPKPITMRRPATGV